MHSVAVSSRWESSIASIGNLVWLDQFFMKLNQELLVSLAFHKSNQWLEASSRNLLSCLFVFVAMSTMLAERRVNYHTHRKIALNNLHWCRRRFHRTVFIQNMSWCDSQCTKLHAPAPTKDPLTRFWFWRCTEMEVQTKQKSSMTKR